MQHSITQPDNWSLLTSTYKNRYHIKQCGGSGMFIPDPGSRIPVPRSKNSSKREGSGKNLFRIPDPGVKKAPDPGSRICSTDIKDILSTGWQSRITKSTVSKAWHLWIKKRPNKCKISHSNGKFVVIMWKFRTAYTKIVRSSSYLITRSAVMAKYRLAKFVATYTDCWQRKLFTTPPAGYKLFIHSHYVHQADNSYFAHIAIKDNTPRGEDLENRIKGNV